MSSYIDSPGSAHRVNGSNGSIKGSTLVEASPDVMRQALETSLKSLRHIKAVLQDINAKHAAYEAHAEAKFEKLELEISSIQKDYDRKMQSMQEKVKELEETVRHSASPSASNAREIPASSGSPILSSPLSTVPPLNRITTQTVPRQPVSEQPHMTGINGAGSSDRMAQMPSHPSEIRKGIEPSTHFVNGNSSPSSGSEVRSTLKPSNSPSSPSSHKRVNFATYLQEATAEHSRQSNGSASLLDDDSAEEPGKGGRSQDAFAPPASSSLLFKPFDSVPVAPEKAISQHHSRSGSEYEGLDRFAESLASGTSMQEAQAGGALARTHDGPNGEMLRQERVNGVEPKSSMTHAPSKSIFDRQNGGVVEQEPMTGVERNAAFIDAVNKRTPFKPDLYATVEKRELRVRFFEQELQSLQSALELREDAVRVEALRLQALERSLAKQQEKQDEVRRVHADHEEELEKRLQAIQRREERLERLEARANLRNQGMRPNEVDAVAHRRLEEAKFAQRDWSRRLEELELAEKTWCEAKGLPYVPIIKDGKWPGLQHS